MKQNFVQGAMILVVAGLITRALGTIYRIFLSRYLGAEAIGLYQMAFPTLIMLITIVTAGLPVAVAKLVAEADAKRDYSSIKKIVRISLSLVLLISSVVAIIFYFIIPIISNYLLTDERVRLTLLGIVPIVPIISVSSILRGYFQGKQNMIPSAISTIIETIFRLIFGMTLSLLLLPYGAEYASFGAMIGMVIGEIVGFIILIIQYFSSKRNYEESNHSSFTYREKGIYQKLSRIAVPVTTSQVIGSIAYFFEPSVVAHSLAIAGITTGIATALYGQLAGMALLIVNFPTVITYSLSQSLIPAVSEAAARRNLTLIYKRLHQALIIAFLIGLPASILMFVLADPIAIIFFDTPSVGHLIKIMSPFAIFLYIQRPLAATLQGLDLAKESMKNSIFGAISKTIAIFILASRPEFGIDGVALAINIGMILVTTLHFRSIIHIIGYTIEIKPIITISLSGGLMGYITYLIMSTDVLFNTSLGLRFVISLIVGAIVYIYSLLLFKVIRKQDFERIPWIGSLFTRILP